MQHLANLVLQGGSVSAVQTVHSAVACALLAVFLWKDRELIPHAVHVQPENSAKMVAVAHTGMAFVLLEATLSKAAAKILPAVPVLLEVFVLCLLAFEWTAFFVLGV